MNLFNFLQSKYKGNDEAVIISSYFNPMHSPYRLKAFNTFYDSIKHLNHVIVECVIGDAKPELPESENIQRIHTENLLWHKESILNLIISKLPRQYKYVFWIDADVTFTNKNWLIDAVEQLQGDINILQPFEYCVHMDKDETKPSFNLNHVRSSVSDYTKRHKKVWRSFSANYVTTTFSSSSNYDQHGHVGFAWGAKRELLERVPLYDKALIGGADHIIAHAAAGQIGHPCIKKSFTDDLENVLDWSRRFYAVAKGKIGYVKGDLFHIWHGDINKRQYLKRIQDFTIKTKSIGQKDSNGLFVTKQKDDPYVKNYFRNREVSPTVINNTTIVNQDSDDGFLTSMALGYMTDSTLAGGLMGGNFLGGYLGSALRDNNDSSLTPIPASVNSENIYAPVNSTNEVERLPDGTPILEAPDAPTSDTGNHDAAIVAETNENFS